MEHRVPHRAWDRLGGAAALNAAVVEHAFDRDGRIASEPFVRGPADRETVRPDRWRGRVLAPVVG